MQCYNEMPTLIYKKVSDVNDTKYLPEIHCLIILKIKNQKTTYNSKKLRHEILSKREKFLYLGWKYFVTEKTVERELNVLYLFQNYFC